MKGLLFALVDGYVIETWGEAALDAALAACAFETTEPFLPPGTYPDRDFHELVRVCASRGGVGEGAFLRALGHFALPVLIDLMPQAVAGYSHPLPCLRAIHGSVFPEAERLFHRSHTPRLRVPPGDTNPAFVEYSSERRLCALAAGMMEALGDHFDVATRATHTACVLEGAETCRIQLDFDA